MASYSYTLEDSSFDIPSAEHACSSPVGSSTPWRLQAIHDLAEVMRYKRETGVKGLRPTG